MRMMGYHIRLCWEGVARKIGTDRVSENITRRPGFVSLLSSLVIEWCPIVPYPKTLYSW